MATTNYTPEQTKVIVDRYTAVREADQATRDATVKALAMELKKNERSIRGVLARIPGLYVRKVIVSKVTGETPAKKEELATRLIAVSGVDANKVSVDRVANGLNKTDLLAFIAAFEAMQSEEETSEEETAEEETTEE